jgi:hypothetical protein
MRPHLLTIPTFIALSSIALAQEGGPVPPPPEVDVEGAEAPVDPDISIREEDDQTIYEYRSSEGKLYMVKIVPRGGQPYYLLDTDGDGELDARYLDPESVAIQMWELFRW